MDLHFRLSEKKDLVDINRIYNQAIEHGHQTADLKQLLLSETEDWYDQHGIEKYPVFVLEFKKCVVAWSSLSRYRRGRQALSSVAEISYYVDQDSLGLGIGKELIAKTIEMASQYELNTLLAILLASNIPSISILERFGFVEWGRIPGAANIDEQKVDHLYYGLKI
ncbi:MAG: N-acetyltransferase [Bacteroidales bacterium]|nr:N-acetyltransferase [Bacteroidales bacterium]